MESRYGGGNNQQFSPRIPQSSNYSYFAEQARAAAYRGPEIRRAPHEFFRDHHQHHLQRPEIFHPHPLSHPQLHPPPHPNAIHDAILREIEKEKIREEIIISEIARRRVLEAEVRRELMIERELALQRGGDGFQFGSGPQMGFDPPTRLAITGPRFEGRSLDERIGMSQEETRRLNGARENGGFETLPFQNPAMGLRISEIKPLSESGKEKVILLAKPRENVSGSKRKASTPPGADAIEIPIDEILKKKAKEEWSCSICKVNATSDRGLNEHLQGKRHKSKEKALRAQRSEKNYSIGLLPKKATKSIKDEDTVDPGEPLVTQKKNKSKLVKKVEKNDDHKKKKYNFWCEMCKVGTMTLKTMNIHKKGKKHVRRVDKLKDDHVDVDKLKDDHLAVDEIKEDQSDVDKLKEDDMAGDELKEDRTAVDELKEDHTAVDELKDDGTASDEMKEDRTAVDEMKEDPTAVDEIKEDQSDVDKLKEDDMAGDELKEDRTAVDELKDDGTARDEMKEDRTAVGEIKEDHADVDKLKEDRTAGDEMKEDRTAVDEMKEDHVDVDKLKEDRTAGDEIKEDRTAGDEMKEEPTAGDEMKEGRTAVDEMKEDDTAVEIAKPEDELTVDVVESK